MSNPPVSTVPSVGRMALNTLVVSAGGLALTMLALGPGVRAGLMEALAASRLHGPRLELIAQAPAVIQIHLATVLAAFAVASFQMIGPKGTRLHRALGWTLTALFIVTAIDSLFIRNPGAGPFNPFQAFSAWTLIGIPLAVWAARTGRIGFHARMMTGFYVGSLVIAGALTFLPGRLLWRVFFG